MSIKLTFRALALRQSFILITVVNLHLQFTFTIYIYNLHPGDHERAGIFILESRRDLGHLYELT